MFLHIACFECPAMHSSREPPDARLGIRTLRWERYMLDAPVREGSTRHQRVDRADERGRHRRGDRGGARVLRRDDGGRRGQARRAFHPRACIVGNHQGQLEWQTFEEFVAECKEAAGDAGAYGWRIDGLSFQGDTALVRLRDQFAGEWYSDDLSMLRIDGAWRIVHKTWYVHPAEAAGTQ